MLRTLLYIILGFSFSFNALASEVVLSKRSFKANRIEIEAPIIDGKISDEAWLGAEVLSNFIQNTPIPED